MRSLKIGKWIAGALSAACLAFGSGCGSKSATNVVSVSLSSSAGTSIIVGSSTTITATVSGATNLGVNWTPGCQYTTTTVTNGKATTSSPIACTSDGKFGTLTNEITTAPATATYTAPSSLPDPATYPQLQIIITVQSQQDTKKTGSITLFLDSGIISVLTPQTATVPTKEQQLFIVQLSNDLQAAGVTWLLTQQVPTSTISYPNLTTCSPGCGTIQPGGKYDATYTAPTSVPTATTPTGASTTPQNLTIVVTPKADATRFATGTITIIQGGPITFNAITPTLAPQGATLWDIYLDAPNISSASSITLTDQNKGFKTFDSSGGQIKILFPIPTSTTPNPASIGARLRLLEGDLEGINSSAPGTPALTYTVTVTDPGETVTATGGPYSFTVTPVRPTSVASVPDDVIQGTLSSKVPVTVDGGYFGPHGELAQVLFQGNTLTQQKDSAGNPLSNSRQLFTQLPSSGVNTGQPGLYPLSLSRTTLPTPSPNNPAVTTMALFPDYSAGPPASVTPQSLTGTNPSAIDIDPVLGVIVVADAGSGTTPGLVEFWGIGSTGALTSLGSASVGALPTGVSVNRTNHSVAVVNYGSQTVSILPIPGAPTPVAAATIDISNSKLLPNLSPAPLPYSIGVDSDTNLALVAYSSTSTSSAANLGFVLNLDQGTSAFRCGVGVAVGLSGTPPCVLSQVTLNTGADPQITAAPHGHTAYVTPGGTGIVRGVDLTQTLPSANLTNVTLTAGGTVTATLASSSCGPTSQPSQCLIPGFPYTVLISGVPTLAAAQSCPAVNFNGVYSISVSSDTTFSYFIANTGCANGSVSGTTSAPNIGTVSFGTSNLNFAGLSQTTQGIAINPITHTAALADPNATGQNGPQINLLSQLDQSVNSIRFFTGCTAYTTTCSNAPELVGTGTGTARVAWQPNFNAVVSYNAYLDQVSISDPVTQKRYALISLSAPNVTGAGTTQVGGVTLSGGIVVDPDTNHAYVIQSGAGKIQNIDLSSTSSNAMKKVEITEAFVPSTPPAPPTCPSGSRSGAIPNASLPVGTFTSSADLCGVKIFGSGFTSGSGTQVRLDGTPITTPPPVSDREIDVTIPASFLSAPHRYALDVVSGGVQSNATDFIVVQSVDMTKACSSAPPQPSSVAIADQLKEGAFSPIAVVSNGGCNSISVLDINPAHIGTTFGTILNTYPVGANPQGVAVSSHLGLAVVANNGDKTASIVDLTTGKQPVPALTTGTNPTGVAINDATGAAIITNFGSNTISEINLALLSASPVPSPFPVATIGGVTQPIAVAIDPDRGTNNQGLAVVTALQLVSGSSPVGALYPVDIGLASPTLSTTVSIGTVNATPTSIVFDPAVSTGTANPGVFYVNSSGTNQIFAFNPDNGSAPPADVGINPTALAVNPQTGAVLTTNFVGQSVSIVDTLSNPFKTRQTLGLPGSAQFGVAIDQFTNLAVIVDQANNRVFLFAMPN